MATNLDDAFPNLGKEGFTKDSPATRDYNCIAWAAGDKSVNWWPDLLLAYHWPDGVPRVETLEAFVLAFQSIGYLCCNSGELEPSFEKIAIYMLDEKPTHAARQFADGRWTSKLGKSIDISHTLSGLEGPVYGRVAAIMSRPRIS